MPTTAPLIAKRYRLQRVVGRGGMGEVWLAEDVVLGRQVAAKRIGARDASERDLVRARQEARVTAMLDHQHVVRVFDLVVEQGEQWLVMELVESENLARLVRRVGPLDVTTTARLALQAAQALAAAHAAGIVHRDVKPSNLLVTPSWHVKLGDFGIARLEGDVGTTRTGQLVGSPGYLAPEVGTGGSATPASDMWSLGATLFHAMEGHAPYRTENGNVMGTLYRIVNEPPPPMTRGGWLEPLVLHLMVHDPAGRWSAEQVANHLEDGLRTAPASTQSRAPIPFPRRPDPADRPERPGEHPDPEVEDDATASLLAATPGRRAEATPAPTNEKPVGRGERRGIAVWAMIAVAVTVLAVLLVIAFRPGENARDDTATNPATSTPSPSGSSTTSPSPTPTATPAGIETFVRDYLRTAASDPQQGFGRLTPAFQRESGNLQGYLGFWGKVESATPSSVDADPEALTVSYDVAYRLDDGSRDTDQVRLQLTFDDGTYLIAGEPE